ncbi:MAG: hypothetical protein ACKPKO_06615, partial [Candidatus Fonsibacter sp.]
IAIAALAECGQELNLAKLRVWSPSVPAESVPEEWRSTFSQQLRIMGSPAAFARPARFADLGAGQDDDWRDTPVTVFAPDDDGGHILRRTAAFFDRALAAKADGLPVQDVVAMTALWIGAARNHFLRSGSASQRYAEAHDGAAVAFADKLFGLDGADPNVTREVMGLPTCMGGLG